MDYKYLKYKKKYTELKNKIKGGFFGDEVQFMHNDTNFIDCNQKDNDFFKASVAGINYFCEEKFLSLGSNGTTREALFRTSINFSENFNILIDNINEYFKLNFYFTESDFVQLKLTKIDLSNVRYLDNDYIEILDDLLSDLYSYFNRCLAICVYMYDIFKIPLPSFLSENQIPYFYYRNMKEPISDKIGTLFKTRMIDELDSKIDKIKPIFINLNKSINEKNAQNIRLHCLELLDKEKTNDQIRYIKLFYLEPNYNYQLISEKKGKCTPYLSTLSGCSYQKLNTVYEEIKKNSYFNQEQLTRLKKFKQYEKLINTNELYKKNIGQLSLIVDKQQLFYNNFYKRGFLTATGPSGSIPYYLTIYLIMVNDNSGLIKLIDNFSANFFLLCIFYMGIRGDHSLFEMILTLPWSIINSSLSLTITSTISNELFDIDITRIDDDEYIKTYLTEKKLKDKDLDSIRELNKEWAKFNQTYAWELLHMLITDSHESKFTSINNLLNERINFIKEICNI